MRPAVEYGFDCKWYLTDLGEEGVQAMNLLPFLHKCVVLHQVKALLGSETRKP